MIDIKNESLYTSTQVEEIAKIAAQQAIASVLHLDNRIWQGDGGETMPSNYNETYYFLQKDGTVSSVRLYGQSKKDTDQKFMMFLQSQTVSTVPTLSDFVNNSYKKNFMRKLSPTTVTNYNTYLDRYILPNLGDKHLDQITVEDIQKLYDWMAKAKEHGCRENLNADTIKRVSGLIGRLYRIATEMKLVNESPIKKTLLSNEGSAPTHHQSLPDKEVVRIKKEVPYLPNEQQRLYMGLLIYTGMRREEIAGIGWEHMHLEDRYGEIRRVVVYPDGKNAIVRNKTKTIKSTREFIIPEPLFEILKPYEREEGYIIHGKDEAKPAPISTLKRTYKAAFKTLGITDYDNHDWRATFGTQLKEAGMTSAQVADLMGHADTRMVETTYAPTRHEGIMKHKNTLDKMNSWFQPTP